METLLRHIVLWSDGTPVEVAGIGVRLSPQAVPVLRRCDDPAAYRRTSPVVYLIAAQLTTILRYVSVIDSTGTDRRIEGFSFRDQAAWQEISPPDPNELLQYVAGPCRIACSFCYLKGNPPALRRIHTRISDEEFAHRLQLFRQGIRAFPKNVLSTDEQTTSPRLFPALEAIRAVSDGPVYIETNGVALTARLVDRLTGYRPLFVNVSVNSMNPEIRHHVMGDRTPGRVNRALRILRDAEIPFSASIVPWHEIPLDDVEDTVRLAAQHGAGHIRLRLPGHTSHFAPEPLFDLDAVWNRIIERVQGLRPDVRCPILVEPGKYEQLRSVGDWITPVVLGVVEGSPASAAGVRTGDHVTSVNGVPMFWRSDGLKALVRLLVNRQDVLLGLQRSGKRLKCRVRYAPQDTYPFVAADYRSPYGIFLCDDIDREAMPRLKSLLATQRAQRPLLVTSRLMERSARHLVDMFAVDREFPGLRLAVIPNAYFGGNIFMGDLIVADDVIRFLSRSQFDDGKPDLVILPGSAFNEWGRDLVGFSYRRIQHLTGVPVVLIPTRMITQ